MRISLRCPDCFSHDIEEYDPAPGILCSAFLPFQRCTKCDAEFLFMRDLKGIMIIDSILEEVEQQLTDVNEYLVEEATNSKRWVNPRVEERAIPYLIRQISSIKSLAKLKLIAMDGKYVKDITKQAEFLNSTNPVLFELEVLLNKVIPHVESMTPETFGFEVNEHSILGLNLADNFIKQVPDRIFLFANLRKLYLQNNEIGTIPDSINKIQRVEVLDLHGNNIELLPSSITDLKNLKSLKIDSSVKLSENQKEWITQLRQENNCIIEIL